MNIYRCSTYYYNNTPIQIYKVNESTDKKGLTSIIACYAQ